MEPTGETVALIVRVQPAADGGWLVSADGGYTLGPTPLPPLTLVVRLWRASDARTLRGTVQLAGGDKPVSIQSNTRLLTLLAQWLGLDQAQPACAPEPEEHPC